MMKLLLVLLVLLTLDCIAKPKLKLGVSSPANTPAFRAVTDYWDAISIYTGHEYEIIPMGPDRELREVTQNHIDGGSSQELSFIKQDSNLIVIEEPFAELAVGVIASKKTKVKTWADLKNKKVVLLESSKHLLKQVNKQNASATLIKYYADLVNFVCLGRADAAVLEMVLLPPLVEGLAKCPQIGVQNSSIDTVTTYSYLHKKHSDKIINIKRAMIMVKESGKFDKIIENHFGKHLAQSSK
jgi:ABC-type amino acid transport substrate-binding protein